MVWASAGTSSGPGGGGGGGRVLGLENSTDCGPTTAERWLPRSVMAKGGLSSYYIVG